MRTGEGIHAQSKVFNMKLICVQTNQKAAKKAKTSLDSAYSYLGGNAFGRDKKGRVAKDDSTLSSDMAAAGVGAHGGEGNEYTAYVYYDFEVV
jgi:V-type H+-transporting ATPase subunit C